MAEEVPRELFQKKQKQRAALKAEYWKQITNPHRHGSGEGGHLFDAGIQRFMSMKATGVYFFKPNFKTSAMGLLIFVAPLSVMMYMCKSMRDSQEAKFRNGLVSYRDRKYKFM